MCIGIFIIEEIKNAKGGILMTITFQKNSLNAVYAKIVPFDMFIIPFWGEAVTIWHSSEPSFYSIDSLSGYKFVKEPDMLVLFGSNDNVKVSISRRSGFGIKIKGSLEHFWVDVFNENEVLSIKYLSEKKEEGGEK